MSDEGFHEIQLNGKQLVFLFMAAAVVAVVVFLSGVMVGRGVRTEMAAQPGSETAAAVDIAATGAAAVPPQQGTSAPAPQIDGNAPGSAAMPPPVTPPRPVADDIGRADPPEVRGTSQSTAKLPAAQVSPGDKAMVPAAGRDAGARLTPPDASAKAAPLVKAPAVAASTAPAGSFSVQVSAPKDRAAAEAIARRLAGKGYNAYVVEPAPGSPAPIYYRVRVGPFKTRREADEAKRRLEKEEQYTPFITR